MSTSDYDLATAALISEYLLTGMHHSTVEGREAIAGIIAERDEALYAILTQKPIRKRLSPQ